jgi:hypothetical protein
MMAMKKEENFAKDNIFFHSLQTYSLYLSYEGDGEEVEGEGSTMIRDV